MTSRLIAIDPGLHALGVAWFDDGVLIRAAFLKLDVLGRPAEAREWAAAQRPVNRVVVERMTVYPPRGRFAKRIDPKWLVLLSEVVGGLALVICAATTTPATAPEWKGRVTKETTAAEVRAVLTPAELEAIEWPAPSLRHNVSDAIGLGLWALERSDRPPFVGAE